MTVEDWFASRTAAYAEFEAVEGHPESTQEDVDWAWSRFHWVRSQLNRWKLNESAEWRREWRRVQNGRISEVVDELGGSPKLWRDKLGGE